MAVDVTTVVEIDRTVPVVSAYAADPDHAPAWYVNIKHVGWRSGCSLEIGARIAFVARFLGRHIAYTYEIAEWRPADRLVMRTADGPFPMETTYTWQALPGGRTRMTLRNRGVPAGFSVWVAPVLALAMRRANRRDLARLKQLLERSATPP